MNKYFFVFGCLFFFGVIGFVSIYNVCSDKFVDTLRDFSIALLTILIPFAIAIMTDLLSKQNSEVDFKTIDLHIILDDILQVKPFVFSVMSLFGLLLLMDGISNDAQFLLFILWLMPVGFVIFRIIDFYLWSKGDIWAFRLDYLRNNENINEYDVIWKSVLVAKFQDINHEKEILKTYENKILKLANNPKELAMMLNLLETNLENRNFYIMVDLLPVVFQINKKCFDKMKHKDNYSKYHQAYYNSNSLIKMIISNLQSSNFYLFFEELKKFVDLIVEEEYKNHLLEIVFYKVVNHVEAKDSDYNLWRAFPKEWLITEENLTKTEVKIFLNSFIRWLFEEFNKSEQYTKTMAEIVRNIMPEIEPIAFSSLIILWFRQDVAHVVKIGLGFGGMSRVYAGWGEEFEKDAEGEEKKQKEATYKLLRIFFPQFFNKDKIGSILAKLGSITTQDQYETTRKNRLEQYLSEMLNQIDGMES